jgi:hypothetical protein
MSRIYADLEKCAALLSLVGTDASYDVIHESHVFHYVFGHLSSDAMAQDISIYRRSLHGLVLWQHDGVCVHIRNTRTAQNMG